MNKKKVVTFVVIVLLIVLGVWYFNCPSCRFGNDSRTVTITTGSTSGTYFAIGKAIAEAVNKSGELNVTSEKGNGSVDNIQSVADKDTELGITQADIAYWAYNGEHVFKNAPIKSIRAICALYPEQIQLLVAKRSNINKLEDLKGKRVGVGLHGSGVEGDVKALLDQAGMSMDDILTGFLDFSTITTLFSHNRLDAGFIVAGVPTAPLTELFMTINKRPECFDVTLLNFDDEFLSKLQKAYPFIIPSVIPAGTYEELGEIKTPAVMSLLVVREDADEEMVYNFLEALYKNIDIVQNAHKSGANVKLETAMQGVTIPFHPAAEKFFRDKGILK
ncbi:MAG: TAXI family TRAP transporter solute-binding subunit [Synergistaceae bacterium]|nr:TAXI family TRAP transporter solute-binding subunit [Synergistaceae bacterium]